MTQHSYRILKYTALAMVLAWGGWSLYDFFASKRPGDFAYHAGSNYFADGHYQKALQEYRLALEQAPDHVPARRGLAETLILLDREPEAIALYRQLLERFPDNAGYHANLGIAYDRIGQHRQALGHYLTALQLDAEVAEGPGWLTRFFRKQYQKPPGIAERAAYLQQQFELPAEQRLLRLPELDQAQQPYKD